jgi:hypothetical protein
MEYFLSTVRKTLRDRFFPNSPIALIIPDDGISALCASLPDNAPAVRSIGMVQPGLEVVVLRFMREYVKEVIPRADFSMDIDGK